jgi:DNA-directed RNA polymerase alpha subunit
MINEIYEEEYEEEYEEGLLSQDDRFNFSVRLINILRAENVFTLEELLQHSESDLMKFPNLGKVSLQIIKDQLLKYDLQLAGKRIKK